MPMNALIYARVSLDRSDGRSVEEQERECRLECERHGWTVADVLVDNSIGASRHSKGNRVAWELVRERIASGDIDVLVLWEASRAGRDLASFIELRDLLDETGTKISYSGRLLDLEDPGDRFGAGLDSLISERAAEDTSKRVRRAMRSNAEHGRPHGRLLFGYRRLRDENTGKVVDQVPDDEQAAVVRRVFADYNAGASRKQVADDLNADGHTTSSGGAWDARRLGDMLKNPAYHGRRTYKGVDVGAGAWAPLIEVASFETAARRRVAASCNKTRASGTARLLSGVGRCGVCGGKIRSAGAKANRSGHAYACAESRCVQRTGTALDAFVGALIVERLSSRDASEAMRGTGKAPAAVTEAAKEIEKWEAQLDAAADQFAANELSAVMLAKVEQRLAPMIAGARKVQRQAAVPIDINIPTVGVDGWWAGLAPALRREVVNALLAAVVINKTQRGARSFDPASVSIEWAT